MKAKRYFITGIDTDIGKTIVSAIVTEALQADYWKPVQSGDLENTDTMKVQRLISNPKTVFHKEAYALKTPASPHYAAELDGVRIAMNKIIPPATNNHLVVEGAGGLFVPLNDKKLILDLVQQLGYEVIVVSKNYLGSINHTLSTIDALQQREIPIAGVLFNGEPTPSTEDYIIKYTGVKKIGNLEWMDHVSKAGIKEIANKFKTFF